MLAERVDQQKAKTVAMTAVDNRELTLLSSEPFGNLYVFSGSNSFVIVAADDCARPILAYSLDSPIKTEDMPENLQCWLRQLNDEIQYAVDMKLETTDVTRREWELLSQGRKLEPKHRTVVLPLIKTIWHQDAPYNNLCPEGTPAGCVATAMAQIMRYWEWPDRGVGSHSYYHPTYGTLSADFGNTVYDWDHMYKDVTLANPEEDQLAIATLTYHCGVSVDMNYNPVGSGAGIDPVVAAFTSYFDYDPSILQYRHSNDYDADGWVSLLKTELDNGRPVLYAGYSESSGHAFICDGYDANDYFHFNIGWGGLGDGYFAYGAINLEGIPTGSYAYNTGNQIVSGIQAKKHTVAIPENFAVSVSGRDLTLSWSPVPNAHHYKVYDNGILINGNVSNTTYFFPNAPYGSHVCYVKAVDANCNTSLQSEEAVGEILFEGPVPSDVTAEVQGHDVSLSWTAPANETAQLKYGDGLPYSYFGNIPGEGYYWGQRFTKEQLVQYAGMAVTSVEVYLRFNTNYRIIIYREVGDEMEQMAAQDFTVTSPGWNTIELTSPCVIDYTHNLLVAVYNDTDQYVAVYTMDEDVEDNNARVCSYDGIEWASYTFHMSWLMKTNITDGTYTYSIYRDDQAVASNVAGTSYVDTNVPDGYYQYSVRTKYFGSLSDPSEVAEAFVGNVGLVSLSTNPSDGGRVMGDGYYGWGNTATVSASANTGYLFDRWTENGTQVSTSDTFSFVVNGDRQLVAEFRDNDLAIAEVLVTEPSCNGGSNGSVSVVVTSGAAPFVFEFQGQTSPASGNTYTFHDVSAGSFPLKVTDVTGFEVVVDVEIGEPEGLMTGEIKSGSETIGNGGTCSTILSLQEASSPQGAVTYRWTINGIAVDNSNVAEYTPTNLQPGNYTFVREVMDSCTDWTPSNGSWRVFVSQNGVDENEAAGLKIFPNPSSDKVTVHCEHMESITVVSVTGQKIASMEVNDDHAEVDLSYLHPGVYVLEIHVRDDARCFTRVSKL
jgi:hypothetical protein